MKFLNTSESKAIEKFYGDRCAKRSGVRLIKHIEDGLTILREIGASVWAERAFCLHPLFQADKELMTEGVKYCEKSVNPYPVMLVMEYRQWANRWLSDKVDDYGKFTSLPSPGHLEEVKHMLIADKVQNYKDFLAYHVQTHQRSHALSVYFETWLAELGIDEVRFSELRSKI